MNEISAEKISEFVRIKDNYSVKVYKSIDSTNTEAKRLANEKAGNTIIIANEQSEGRGRLGRRFYSPDNGGLYITFLLKSDLSAEHIVSVTTATAVAVKNAIESAANQKPLIKWVNDLYLNGKKICGILAETVWDNKGENPEYLVIGIGINCGVCNFPDDLKNIAGSIGRVDRNLLAAKLIYEMYNLPEMISSKNYINEYKDNSLVIGKDIIVLNTNETAKAIDIDEFGGLVIQTDSGEIRTLSTGEISIRLNQ